MICLTMYSQNNNLQISLILRYLKIKAKVKGILQLAKVAQGVPGRLGPWIFLTFVTTSVVGRQPNALAAFTAGEIPGNHFQRLS